MPTEGYEVANDRVIEEQVPAGHNTTGGKDDTYRYRELIFGVRQTRP